MNKSMWNAEAVKAYESGQGVVLVEKPYPHYEPKDGGWTSERVAGMERLKAQQEALAQPEQDGECKQCTDGCPACDARKLKE